MAVYRVQGPDGAVYRLEGPDGASDEEVSAAAQSAFGSRAKRQETPANPTGSFGENLMAGIGKSFVDAGRGLKQLVDVPAQALERTFGGQGVSRILGMPTAQESAAATQAAVDEAKRLDAPLMNTGGGVIGNITGQAAQLALPAAAAGRAAQAMGMSRYAAPVAVGASSGAAQPVATGDSRATNAAFGAAGGALGQGAADVIGKVARGSSSIRPEVADLARRAEQLGIRVRADQLVNSKPLNAVSAAVDYVPFSGSGAAKQAQQKQFNRALSKTIGENDDNISAAVKNARENLGKKFDEALRNRDVKVDDQFIDDLARIGVEAQDVMTDSQLGVVKRQIDSLLNKAAENNGKLSAEAAYNIKKNLDRIGKSQDSTLAYTADELRGSLMDALNRSLKPTRAKEFAKTRQQYSNYLQLKKIAPAGVEGDISAARLAQSKPRTQDLSELADIGAQFLKGRIGDSGTAQRAAVYGGVPAAFIDPVTTSMVAGAGLTLGRGTNALLGSRAASNYLMNGLPALQRAQPAVNSLLPLTGAVLPNALRE